MGFRSVIFVVLGTILKKLLKTANPYINKDNVIKQEHKQHNTLYI